MWESKPILLCCIVMEISTGWGRFWGGGGRFDPSLAVRWVAPTTHSISCLDSSLGRVPACDAGDPGSIPAGGKLNAWDTVPFWPLDPGSGIGFFRIPDLGSWIPTPYFWELIDNFGLKVLFFYENWPKFLSSAIQNWNNLQFCEICGYIKSYDN